MALKNPTDLGEYQTLHEKSLNNPEEFWDRVAKDEITWKVPYRRVLQRDHLHHDWFVGGKTNISYDCLDRNIKRGLGNKVAYIFVSETGEERRITYQELLIQVEKTAIYLKEKGVGLGDRIALYLPSNIEVVVFTLACARIGAIHSIVFAGFGPEALRARIEELECKIVVTADFLLRRGKRIDLLSTARAAVERTAAQEGLVVIKRDSKTPLRAKESDYIQELVNCQGHLAPVWLEAKTPLFVLYTSGTTGKPKGIVHALGGYSVYASLTTRLTFNLQGDEVFWCTADVGWITGHTYVIYGPLMNGLTTLLIEGAPDYPTPGVWWSLIDKYRVNVFYTSPTAIRLLIKFGEAIPKQYKLDSLKLLGSVGEPLNPTVSEWYAKNIGKDRVPVVDTWWQTETGGHMIATLPTLPQKVGYAGLPFFGVKPLVVDSQGKELSRGQKGLLVIGSLWPGALQTCWQNEKRFQDYWQTLPPYYATGDFAVMDQDGYVKILGRSDDLISVAGHRISSAELENILVAYPGVAEAAVVGKPDEIKGESIKAFIVLKKEVVLDDELGLKITEYVRKTYGPIGMPSEIEFVEKLPKTRSGKIVRRILKNKEMGVVPSDTSTLED